MQEQLYSADMPVSPVRGSDLFITSGIIQEFLLPVYKKEWTGPPGNAVLWCTLAKATKTITGQEIIREQPVPFNEVWERFLFSTAPLYKEIDRLSQRIESKEIAAKINETKKRILLRMSINHIYAEICALTHAAGHWLSPGSSMPAIDFDLPIPLFNDQENLHALASYCLNARAKEVRTMPAITEEGVLERVHQSKGLLPLAWMEIWYALDHDINAKVCPYCAKVFVPSPFHPRTAHCQGDECKKAYLIQQKGGIEGYRKWERERKK